jgi:UDP-2,3-diacylglucosamine hydrolase
LTTVLGTVIAQLPAPEPRALLLSDLHVPADGGSVVAALQAALDAGLSRRALVVVLGDLFDTYLARVQVRHGVWRDIAGRFRRHADAGGRIVVLHGNRDFLLGAEFAKAAGVRLVPGGLRGVLGEADTLLLHGDELCVNDLPYQRAKRWLRSPPVRWLCRALPLRVALAVAERARQRSRQVIAAGDQTRFLPTAASLSAAFAIGVRRLVFGHIHRHASGSIGAGEYRVLPAFDATATGLWLESGQATSVRCVSGGELTALPAPGPCPLGG